MIMTRIEDRVPEIGSRVLIKIKDCIYDSTPFYVCQVVRGYNPGCGVLFEELCGEQYVNWKVNEVEAWITLEDLDKEVDY